MAHNSSTIHSIYDDDPNCKICYNKLSYDDQVNMWYCCKCMDDKKVLRCHPCIYGYSTGESKYCHICNGDKMLKDLQTEIEAYKRKISNLKFFIRCNRQEYKELQIKIDNAHEYSKQAIRDRIKELENQLSQM